jgi:hypothetical protein
MNAWSRRSFIAAAGTLAAAGGAGAATSARGAGGEVLFLRTYVTGAERRVVRDASRELSPGAPLRLLREPENDYDARAVAVWTPDGTKVGYVPRIDNQGLANLMDAGIVPRATVGSVCAHASRPDLRIEVSLRIT